MQPSGVRLPKQSTMTDLLFFDTETFSSVKIELGLDQYLTGMQPLIYTYALNDEPVEVWDVTKSPNIPQKLEAALRNPNVTKVAHNLPFDHAITRVGLGIDIPFEECFCTMSCAYAHSLHCPSRARHAHLSLLAPILHL